MAPVRSKKRIEYFGLLFLLVMATAPIKAGDELQFAFGVAYPGGKLADNHGKGIGGFGAYDYFVSRVVSLGGRLGYVRFKVKERYQNIFKSDIASIVEVSGRFCINTSRQTDRAGFFHLTLGLHKVDMGAKSESKIGGGIGTGFRIPLSGPNNSSLLFETTYYVVDMAPYVAFRMGMTAGR
jgi:hypothetical protein